MNIDTTNMCSHLKKKLFEGGWCVSSAMGGDAG